MIRDEGTPARAAAIERKRLGNAVALMRRALARLRGVWILAVGCAGLWFYAYPGFLSYDSVVQLREARSGVYSNWHPPVMAALWRCVEHVVAGPFGMLVLQSTAFIVGAYLMLRRYVSPRWAAILATLLLWFPPVSTTFAVIWKDCQMIGFLMLGTAWLLSKRRWIRIAGLAALGLASAMRLNGFTFAFALVIGLFVWSNEHRSWRRYLIATVAWLTITWSAQAVNNRLTSEQMYPWHGSVALFDIVGTLRYSPPLTDREVLEVLEGTPLIPTEDLQDKALTAYSPVEGHFKVINDGFFRPPATEAERTALTRAWKSLVLEHPIAYLRHRWHAFRELLALSNRAELGVWIGVDGVGADLVRDEPSKLQNRLRGWATWFGSSWLMRPYLYLLIIVALLPFCLRERERLATALAASALVSEAALFFACPTPDFRYSLWLVPCAFLITVILIATRFRQGSRSAEPASVAA